jgi:hypothetical protein
VSVPEGPTITAKRRDTSAEPDEAFGDVGLLLRAHAEHGWLRREVLPVVHQIETPGELPASQRGAARAYLEFAWEQAEARARRTDDSRARLRVPEDASALCERACRYHALVRELRERLAERVGALLTPAAAPR